MGAESNTLFIPTFFLCLGILLYIVVSVFKPLWPLKSRMQLIPLSLAFIVIGPLALGFTASLSSKGSSVQRGSSTPNTDATSESSLPDRGDTAPVLEVAVKSNVAEPIHDLKIAGLTHHNKAIGKKLTYRQPRITRLDSVEVAAKDWTIKQDHTDVICFADGNNAVFFTIADRIYAANGMARQFVDYKDGDGIVLKDGTVERVFEVDRGAHFALANNVTKVGLALCGEKSLDEIVEAAQNAADSAPSQASESDARDEALMNAALAIVGAEMCGYDLDPVPVVDYLQAKGLANDDFKSEIPQYVVLAKGMLGASDDRSFCERDLLPKFGPDGLGFVAEK